jgi:MSHA pilin protein MshC
VCCSMLGMAGSSASRVAATLSAFLSFIPEGHDMRLSFGRVEAIKREADYYSGELRHARGFTMIELITVMLVIGILAAFAAPRLFDNTFESRGFYDQALSTLRYAQKAAIAQNQFVCASFTANSVNLTYGTNSNCTIAAGALASPSGTPYPLTGSNATFSSFPAAGFSFDALGRPYNIGDTPPVSTFVKQQITVSGYANAVTVEAETGYVH